MERVHQLPQPPSPQTQGLPRGPGALLEAAWVLPGGRDHRPAWPKPSKGRLCVSFTPFLQPLAPPSSPAHPTHRSQTQRGILEANWKFSPHGPIQIRPRKAWFWHHHGLGELFWARNSRASSVHPLRSRPAEARAGRCSAEAGWRPGMEHPPPLAPGLRSGWPWLPWERVVVSQAGTKASLQSRPHPWAGSRASWF